MTKRDSRPGGPLAACLAAAVVVLGVITGSASGAPASSGLEGHRTSTPERGLERADIARSDVIPGRYIVVYEEDLERGVNPETRQRERRLGFESSQRYRHTLEGFAARLTPGQVRTLERDPEVEDVTEDRRVSAAGEVPLALGDLAPTGVRRMLAATGSTAREASGVGVAVIDTGVKLDHPDLVVEDGTDCIDPGTPADDGDGHGTHVAGTIGAENDGAGVVGVAPGTAIHAVRVLDDNGKGTWSQVICGVDWVTANSDALDIGVANMSLGGLTDVDLGHCGEHGDPVHAAICESTAAGVTYAVAAGNMGDGEQEGPWEFDHPDVPNIPAAYPEVLTVTAMSDSDGDPGGNGGDPACWPAQGDDVAASFSNFALTPEGEAHTIAAPGVCILSTYTGAGGYAIASGTSMATPHVAAAVALCIDEGGAPGDCAGMAPAETIDHVRAEAQAYNEAEHPAPDPGLGYGFRADPLNDPGEEYLGFLTVAPLLPTEEPTDDSGDGSDGSDGTGGGSGGAEGSDGGDASGDSGGDTGDPSDPESPAGDSTGDDGDSGIDGTAPSSGPASLPAALEVRAARLRGNRSNRRLVVRGSLHPDAAAERIVIRFRARGKQLRMRPAVRPGGRFVAKRRLRGRQRSARGGRVLVRYRGNESLRPATERLRVGRRSVRLRFNRSAPRVRSGRLIVAGRVRPRAPSRVRVAVEFNRTDGSAAEVSGVAFADRRGRFRARMRLPRAARSSGGSVVLVHRGRGRLYGQRLERSLSP